MYTIWLKKDIRFKHTILINSAWSTSLASGYAVWETKISWPTECRSPTLLKRQTKRILEDLFYGGICWSRCLLWTTHSEMHRNSCRLHQAGWCVLSHGSWICLQTIVRFLGAYVWAGLNLKPCFQELPTLLTRWRRQAYLCNPTSRSLLKWVSKY